MKHLEQASLKINNKKALQVSIQKKNLQTTKIKWSYICTFKYTYICNFKWLDKMKNYMSKESKNEQWICPKQLWLKGAKKHFKAPIAATDLKQFSTEH